MTTIAYRDGVLAADTLVTANATFAGYARKIMKRGRLMFAFSGELARGQAFLSWAQNGCVGEPPSMGKEEDASCGLILDGERVITIAPWGIEVVTAPFYAAGSGKMFAMGAMQAGCSAEEAVKAAIAMDMCSGGEIVVLRPN